MQKQKDSDTDRLRAQQRALAEFGLTAFRSRDLDVILNRAAELVVQGLDANFAKVLELLPGGTELLIRAGVNWAPGVVGVVTLGADMHSPAGYALRCDEPVVSQDLDTESRFRIPQVLRDHGVKSMVNVIIASEDGAFGVLEVDERERRAFEEDDIAFLSSCSNLLAAAIDRHRTHAALERAASEQRTLAQELAHRVKNTLAVVLALIGQTAAEEPAARALRDSLLGRLRALAGAEDLLFQDDQRRVDLAKLARTVLEPFEGSAGRIEVQGDPLFLPARSGRILSLVLHELASNATKYGALSADKGVARVSWTGKGAGRDIEVQLQWEESGGPEVVIATQRGFGTRLLTTLAGYELDGEAELNPRSSGLQYRLKFVDRMERCSMPK